MLGLTAKMARLDPKNFKHKRWRDKRGVVHDLEAHKFSGYVGGVSWVSACGKHEPRSSRFLSDDAVVTCLRCLANARPVHDDDCALYCPMHGPGQKCRALHHCALCERA